MARLTQRLFTLSAAALLLSASTATPADDVTDQLDVAREAYEAGNLSQSVDELNYAIAQIQEQLNNSYVKLLPEPLAGWTAEAAAAQAGGMAILGGGTSMSRKYSNVSGGTVEIQVYANSPMIQGMSMMLSNPMLMQMDPSSKMYRYKGNKGVIKHAAGSSSYEISLLLKNTIMVQISGDGLADKAPVVDYLKAMDLDAIKEAFTG